MLLKRMYVPFPGKEPSLFHPLWHLREEGIIIAHSLGMELLFAADPRLDCCFSNLNVQGDHLQTFILNHWDGWDENLHFYCFWGAACPVPETTPWSPWSACAARASGVSVPHMWAHMHVALSNSPSYRWPRAGAAASARWASSGTPQCCTLLPFLCRWATSILLSGL